MEFIQSSIPDISPEIRKLYSEIRTRPGLFLGGGHGESLSLLETYLYGMMCAFHLTQPDASCVFLPDGFNDYVTAHYHRRKEARNYASIIRQEEAGERAAFFKFWELLDMYLISLGYAPIECLPRKTEYSHDDGISVLYFVDVDALAQSFMRTFNAPPWNDAWTEKKASDRLYELYRMPGSYGRVFWNDHKPIGAVIGRNDTYFDGTYFQIIECWVEPEYQGQGIGRQLVTELKEILKSRGIKKIYLTTLHTDATVKFYERCGFETDPALCIMHTFL